MTPDPPSHSCRQAMPTTGYPVACSGCSLPSPSSLSPRPGPAQPWSPVGINHSPALAQLQLPLGAGGVGPEVAWRWQQPSRVGFHASCWGCSVAVTTLPLNYLGLAPLPAPRLPGGSVTAVKSNPGCRRRVLALPAHLHAGLAGSSAAGGPAWGPGHLAKQFTDTHPSGLTPSRLVGNGDQGLNGCLRPRCPPARQPSLPLPHRPSGPVLRHHGAGTLRHGTARWDGSAGRVPSHGYRDQLLSAHDRCDNRAEYLLLFLF